MFNESPPRPPASARAARKQATARAVLAAARAEFEARGFEAASLRAIAARAGVSAGTVIHHHGDKRELLHAALFDDLEATLARALAAPATGSLAAQLAALTRAVFRYYQKRPALSRTLLRESLFAEGPWAARFAAQTASVHAAIAARVRAAGPAARDLDADLVAAAYLSFFYFALIAWVQGGLPKPAALVDRLVAQHLRSPRK